MIDPLEEELFSLTHATKFFPRRRAGKKVAVSTAYRYTNTGHAGVTLEYVQVGNTRCTSREAVARFIQRVTEKTAPEQVREQKTTRSAAKREREIRRAEAELEAAGI